MWCLADDTKTLAREALAARNAALGDADPSKATDGSYHNGREMARMLASRWKDSTVTPPDVRQKYLAAAEAEKQTWQEGMERYWRRVDDGEIKPTIKRPKAFGGEGGPGQSPSSRGGRGPAAHRLHG